MNKPIAFILIIIIAPFIAGVYGILHDQITFSISNEYYTKFKFIQFNLENWGMGINVGTINNPQIQLVNPRYGASIVGFLATWWVGFYIGIVFGLLGLIHQNGKKMLLISLKAIVLVIAISLIVGIIGLIYGKLILTNNPPSWHIPINVINRNNFIIVGAIHNFAYLGAIIGLFLGAIYSFRMRNK